MASESPPLIRPDDPLDIGKYLRSDGTNVIWVPEFGTLDDHTTPTGAALTLSLQIHRAHRARVDANLTLSLSNVPTFCRWFLWLYKDNNATTRTVTFWSGIEWVDDAAGPILPFSTANAIALIELWTINGGTQTLAMQRGNFFP